MLVCLLLSASGVGVLASRKSAWAGDRTLAVMASVGQERPDCRTSSDVRQQPLEAFTEVLVHVVRLAGEAGLGQWDSVSTDGPNIPGHAARPKARSYGERHKAVERVREAIAAVVPAASQQDAAAAAVLGSRRGAAVPAERARREQRLAPMAAARQG
jgi:hypothetical protein